MSTIQIKRGLSTKIATLNLQQGEPAFTTDTGKLYVGDGTTKVEINPMNTVIVSKTYDGFVNFNLRDLLY